MKKRQATKRRTADAVQSDTGPVERYQHGRVTHVERPFARPEELVARLGELVGEFASLQKERKYIQAFRSRHGEFLKRYADLKARLDALHE